MKLAEQNAAWQESVGVVAVCLKLFTKTTLRPQLIMESANGTAYELHFVKEADFKQRC